MSLRLNATARELYDWITRNKYGELLGVSGGGHLRYRLRDGHVYFAAASPSTPAAVKMAQRDIRRRLGIVNETPNSGRYKSKARTSGAHGRL